MDVIESFRSKTVIDDISALNWRGLSAADLQSVAWAYYFFSVQFRECLQTAVSLYPEDEKLQHLMAEECATANLSPWPGVAAAGEAMNHDEFMRRALQLAPIDSQQQQRLEKLGQAYLRITRGADEMAQAQAIASYEDGGLESVFRAFLTAPDWNGALLGAFRHFLVEHIRFDSDPDQGHGALSRHLAPDDRVLLLWQAFRDLLVASVPSLDTRAA